MAAKKKAAKKSTKSSKSTKKKASGTKATQEINKAQASAKAKTAAYKKGKEYKAAEKLQGMTIDDIGKKYGLDFSQGYADKQAETAAQGQRNVYNSQKRDNESAHKIGMQRISDNYDSAAGDLDKGYFQQYMGTKQGQANRGLNAGIAANQYLQLAMNKQGEVADLWKQRNTNTQEEDMRYANTNQTIAEALAQVEREKAMNAQTIHQALLTQGYGILNSDRASANQWADSAWNRTTFDINNDMKFADQRVNDIYNEQRRADELAAEQRAAARAAAAARASRRYSSGGGGGGGGGGSYSGTAKKTVLTPAKNQYDDTINRQKKTPMDKYVETIAPVESWRQKQSPGVANMVKANSYSPANTPYMSAWDKKRALGL